MLSHELKKIAGQMQDRIAAYPELDTEAARIADEVAGMINEVAPTIKSEMPYKAQYILEEVIKDLQERV